VATYAAHGRYCPAYGITDIVRVHTAERPACRQVISAHVADTVTGVLSGVIQKGTGRNARVPGGAAGKTGTVQNFSAAWFVGYTPRYAAAVWMGDPRGGFGHPLINVRVGGRRYPRMYGGDVPAQIWAALISGAPGGQHGAAFQPVAPTAGNEPGSATTSAASPVAETTAPSTATCTRKHGTKPCR
jgi:membrane peptidoglycan carboxypeptidase